MLDKSFFRPFADDLSTVASAWVACLPDDWRGSIGKMLDQVAPMRLLELRNAAAEIGSKDLQTLPFSREQKLALARIWFAAAKKSFESSPDFSFEGYLICLHELVNVCLLWGGEPELWQNLTFLFTITAHFSVAFYDEKGKNAVDAEPALETHVEQLVRLSKSGPFSSWISRQKTIDELQILFGEWEGHLSFFLQARRKKAFELLFTLCLSLLRAQPELSSRFPRLKGLLIYAGRFFPKQEFLLLRNHLNSALAIAPEDTKAFLMELFAVLNPDQTKRAPDSSAGEPTELTVEYAFQTALEEIIGDGIITEAEKTVIEKLQSRLEIPPGLFQTLFNQAKERRMRGEIPVLNRDFSSEEFLFKILVKTVEDGKITAAEKAIVTNICQALDIDRNTFDRVFERAKETRATITDISAAGESDPFFQPLEDTLKIAEKIQTIFHAPMFQQEAAEVCKEILAGPLISGEGIPSVAAFSYDPGVFELPVIGIFSRAESSQDRRLQVKGGLVDVSFLNQTLILHNRCLDFEIMITRTVTGKGREEFRLGLERSGGQYLVVLAEYPEYLPFAFLKKTGYVDFSGELYANLGKIREGKFEEAVAALTMMRTASPKLGNVLYSIGVCRKNLACRGMDMDLNFQEALACYRGELKIHPHSETSFTSIGVVCKHLEKWDEAVQNLEKAYECAPMSIPALVTLITARYNLHIAQGKRFRELPEFLLHDLGQAFQVCPNHPLVLELIEKFESIFKTNLRSQFLLLPWKGESQ